MDFLKDITSIPNVLGTQLKRNRNCITQWKIHCVVTIEKRKPYITRVFRILHPRSLKAFFDWIIDVWAFELGFLREHNG